MEKGRKRTCLENIPSLVFRDHIFKFLTPNDIFNLGQCSKSMKLMVVSEVTHPMSTELQCIKTTVRFYEKGHRLR